ncbi:surface antigen [Plasmodium falciparum UGT5.1]|uniref:Surface antigen n=1 Tax=Plasmodium falciparum UGT5.1 TaxID=1237627 RepID=W7K141_PLAFA|nr:surface antigen [Plasmodium falciparum UGT5.1]
MKPHTYTNRSLCECELYELANYDNDAEMKRVMQQFEDSTSQRFHEYDERMQSKRKQCKERCDKEIQKIILKDKLEKQMAQQLTTLDPNITTEDIPTCVCEKSLADKVEKACLRCGSVFGGGVAPNVGILGGIGEAIMSAWKVAALEAATKYAMKEGAIKGAIAGNAKGMEIVIRFLKQWGIEDYCREIFNSFVSTNRYADVTTIADAIVAKKAEICAIKTFGGKSMCRQFDIALGLSDASGKPKGLPPNRAIPKMINELAGKAKLTANTEAANLLLLQL